MLRSWSGRAVPAAHHPGTAGGLASGGRYLSGRGHPIPEHRPGCPLCPGRPRRRGGLGPPCPYALLALGSGARHETTLRTDQDHALVLADDLPPGAGDWFSALAEQLATTLERGGLPRCAGDVMATNPAWRMPLRTWQEQFARWIERPEEEALLQAAIFFDFRQVHGDLDVEERLRRVIDQAAGSQQFLGRLAAAALRRRPPRRSWATCGASTDAGSTSRPTASPRSSTWPGCSRWKRAAMPRPRSTACGPRPPTARPARPPRPTSPRRSRTFSRSASATRSAAWRPAAPDDVVALADSMLQRRWIRDALHLVHTCQESIRIAYRVDLIA